MKLVVIAMLIAYAAGAAMGQDEGIAEARMSICARPESRASARQAARSLWEIEKRALIAFEQPANLPEPLTCKAVFGAMRRRDRFLRAVISQEGVEVTFARNATLAQMRAAAARMGKALQGLPGGQKARIVGYDVRHRLREEEGPKCPPFSPR